MVSGSSSAAYFRAGLRFSFCVLLCALAACGDKVPESAAAKQAGDAPKQIVDKAVADTAAAVTQGSDRSRLADEGKK